MAPLSRFFRPLLKSRAAVTVPVSSEPRLAYLSAYTVQERASIPQSYTPGAGSQPATDFNNAGFLALFAIIGAGMVVATIWFFFWARNGGFVFREGDWDDYKSTVLRRKGPDGRTLSNATKSTKLGGSTVAGTQRYKWAQQMARSVVSYDEKGRKGILGKRGWAGTHSVTYSDDYMTGSRGSAPTVVTGDEMAEVRAQHLSDEHHHSSRYRDRDVTEYKRERPARVGGLNRPADGSHYGASSTMTPSHTDGSEVSRYTDASEQPMLKKSKKNPDRDRAERKAREEAAKMERRWKQEAEEAAAALAREHTSQAPPPKSPKPAKTTPSSRKNREPSSSHHRRAPSASRLVPPPPMTEETQSIYSPSSALLSSHPSSGTRSVSASSGQRSASYYDAYRPQGAATEGHSRYAPSTIEPSHAGHRTRQSSPKKKKPSSGTQGGRGGAGGYRRGLDSELD